MEPASPPVHQVPPNHEIIGRVLAGSQDAFGILIARYSDPLYRHALGMTGSPDVAEGILQASFIKALRRQWPLASERFLSPSEP